MITDSAIAEMYIKQRRYSEAESLLLGALAVSPEGETQRPAFATASSQPIRETITRELERLYEESGQPAKAAEWRAKLLRDTPAKP